MIRSSVLALLCLASPALASPKVVGSVSELGSWNVGNGVDLLDDGVAPDAVANDGVYTASVTFASATSVEYKIAPNGVDYTGALGATSGANMKLMLPGTSTTVTFRYDTRDLSAQGFSPATESFGDSWTAAHKPDGTAATWVVVGDFQQEIGDSGDFNVGSTVTVANDNGRFGDRVAGDGIFTYRFKAPQAFTNALFKFAAQGTSWTTKFGTDGWSIDPDDSNNGTFSAAAGDLVSFELDTRTGHLRSNVTTFAPAKLVVTEVVSSPTQAEFIEIYNPGSTAVELTNYYLADYDKYYELVKATPTAPSSSDFNVKFPNGATIQPGEYQTVAIAGAECFKTACGSTGSWTGYGVYPTYEIPSTTTANNSATVPDMLPAFANSAPSGRGLTNNGEPVILFAWDQASDLVVDVDEAVFGVPGTNSPANKTGVSVDGPDADTTASSYAAETAFSTTAQVGSSSNDDWCRADFTEGAQAGTGGNGIGGRDETSEAWNLTWKACTWAMTPNAATVHAIDVTPATVALELAGSQTLSASAYGDLGKAQALTGLTPTWTTTPAAPTTFSLTGDTVTATAVGTGEKVTANMGGYTVDVPVTVRYQAITVSCDTTTLPTGGTANCTAQAFDATNQPVSNVTFTWAVQSGTSATVDPATGVVTGDAANTGPVTISATAAGDAVTVGTVTIDVQARSVAQLMLALGSSCPSPDCLPDVSGAYRVAEGATLSFTLTGVDQFNAPITVSGETWSSSNPTASPAPTAGLVTVGTAGVTQITASVNGVTSNAVELDVEARTAQTLAITGSPSKGNLNEGTTAQLGTMIVDQFGGTPANAMVTWQSSDLTVATVDATGLVTGLSAGSAVITATSGTASDTTTINVIAVPKLTTIAVTPMTQSVEELQTTTFTAEALDQYGKAMKGIVFTWSSDNEAVATVDQNGVATGVAAGTANIIASAAGKTGSAALTVTALTPVVTTIAVTPDAPMIGVGQTVVLTAVARDQKGAVMNGVAFTWTSQNNDLATVDANGLVTGVGEGTVTIKAESAGVFATSTVTVTATAPQVATIEISPADAMAQVNGSATFTAVAKDDQGNAVSGVTFVWSSSDTSVATIDQSGVATAKTPGVTTITAEANGKQGSATLTVTSDEPVVARVEVLPSSPHLEVGTGQQFTAHAYDASDVEIAGAVFEWSSTDSTVAPISADGYATGRSPGQTTITAKAGDQEGTVTLTVTAKTAEGCGCAAGGMDPSLLWGLALAGIPMLRRRRRG